MKPETEDPRIINQKELSINPYPTLSSLPTNNQIPPAFIHPSPYLHHVNQNQPSIPMALPYQYSSSNWPYYPQPLMQTAYNPFSLGQATTLPFNLGNYYNVPNNPVTFLSQNPYNQFTAGTSLIYHPNTVMNNTTLQERETLNKEEKEYTSQTSASITVKKNEEQDIIRKEDKEKPSFTEQIMASQLNDDIFKIKEDKNLFQTDSLRKSLQKGEQ